MPEEKADTLRDLRQGDWLLGREHLGNRPGASLRTVPSEALSQLHEYDGDDGGWGVHSFGHALRFIPGNILEFRRTRGVTPLPADPTDAELGEAMESKVRLLAAHGGMSAVFYGSAGALVGLVLVGVLLLNPSAERNSGRTMMGWFGAICLSVGGLVIAWGLARRKSALHGDIGPLPDALPAPDDAPAPRRRAARSAPIATPTARTSTGPKPRRRRRR